MSEDIHGEPLDNSDGIEITPTSEMMTMSSTTDLGIDQDQIEMILSAVINAAEGQAQEQEEDEVLEEEAEQQQLHSPSSPTPPKQSNPKELQVEQVVRPTPPAVKPTVTSVDDDDDFIEDETILERIVALKEMFPESLRNVAVKLNDTMIGGAKLAYSKGRTVSWWLTSTMCVLVFPILIQKELLQVAEQISREQRSILLGPQAATGPISGGTF